MNLFDRFILTLYSMALTIISVFLIALSLRLVPIQIVENAVYGLYASNQISIVYLVAAIIFLVISLRFLTYGFRRKRQSPFIAQRGEIGEIRITLDTIESITSRSSRKVRGVKELKAKVRPTETGAVIHLKVSVDGETSIPQLTEDLQKNVKHDVEQIAGIHVDTVTVLVSDVVKTQVTRARVE